MYVFGVFLLLFLVCGLVVDFFGVFCKIIYKCKFNENLFI